MMMLLWTAQASADCVEVSSAAMAADLAAAEAAYASLDLEGFRHAFAAAAEQLVCLEESIGRVEAATVHRVHALDHYLSQDPEAALAALRSALAAWSGAAPSSSIAPEGNPLHSLIVQARESGAGEEIAMPAADPLSLWVDGEASTRRPTARPYILQAIETDGVVVWSGYLTPEAALPDWVALGLIPEPVPPVPRRFHARMLLAGGVLAAAGGGLYGYSWYRSEQYRDPASGVASSRAGLSDYRGVTNLLAATSTAAFSVGVGLTGLSFAVGGSL